MKKLVLQRAGWLKPVIIFLSILLLVCNLYTLRSRDESIIGNSFLWFPYLVVAVLSLFIEIKSLVYTSCLIVAFFVTANQSTAGDLQGIIFFILALNIDNNKVSLLVVIYTMLVAILTRYFLISMSIPQAIGLFAGNIACLVIYYIPRILKDDQ